MEQVAEALKQLRINEEWDEKLISKIELECDVDLLNSEVKAVLNAIISIYG